MEGLECPCAEAFLMAKLSASLGDVKVVPAPVPPNLEGEIVVAYQFMAGSDTRAVPAILIGSPLVYQVVAVGPSQDIEAVSDAARLIGIALKDATGENDYGRVLSCTRQSPVNIPGTNSAGKITRTLGGTYRLFVQGA